MQWFFGSRPAVPRAAGPADFVAAIARAGEALWMSFALGAGDAALVGLAAHNGPKVLAVTSAQPLEGKTTTAVNVAVGSVTSPSSSAQRAMLMPA